MFQPDDIATQVNEALHGVALVNDQSFGVILVTGADRLDLLHRLSTNDLLSLKTDTSAYTIFTTDKGRIVDLARVIVLEDAVVLIVSAGNERRVVDWINKYTITEDIQLTVVSDEKMLVSAFGPKSHEVIGGLYGVDPVSDTCQVLAIDSGRVYLDFHTFRSSTHVVTMIISSQARSMANKVLSLQRLSAPAFECFRIMQGLPRLGNELVEAFNPYDVALKDAVSFTKGCYIGQEVIAKLDTYNRSRRGLVLLEFDGQSRLPAVQDAVLCNAKAVGVLTSISPVAYRGTYYGLAVAQLDQLHIGATLSLGGIDSPVQGYVAKIFLP